MSSANDNPSHNSHNLASNNGNNISDSLASGKSVIATANNVSGASSHIHNLSNVIAPGILLFIDQILLAAGQWIYWLIISKLTSPSEIGISTAFYSLAILVSTVTQLGLEYPLLKRTSTNNGSKILGTIIILEMMLTALSLPVLFYTSNVMYGEASTREYVWITVGILALTSLGFVTRFALLGLSDAKNVLIFDMIGTALKFGAGYLLVSQGYGGMGILLSFVAYNAIIAAGTLAIAHKRLKFGLRSMSFTKEIIKDGLANMPSKLSKMFVMNLSIVLLASIGAMNSSQVGIFYIELMISLAAGSVASSMAYMIIPASVSANSSKIAGSSAGASASAVAAADAGIRIAFSLTAILVVALLVKPAFVLSLIGPNYSSEANSFFILCLSIIPSAILNSSIAKLNTAGKAWVLVVIGSIQIAVFLFAFFILAPAYELMGAALSILVAFSIAAALSLAWYHERSYLRTIVLTSSAILAGSVAAYSLQILLGSKGGGLMGSPVLLILVSLAVTIITLFGTKSISTSDVQIILRFRMSERKKKKEEDNSGMNVSYPANGDVFTDNSKNENSKEKRKILRHYLMLGNYGNFNVGDEMLLMAAMQDILKGNSAINNSNTTADKNILPSVLFQVPTRNPDFIEIYHKSHSHLMMSLPINAPLKLLRAFFKSKAIVVGGGGIWSGYTGPLAHFIPVITIAGKLLNKQVIFLAIGLYSTASNLDKRLVNLAILLADSCTVRDEESFGLLWKINKRKVNIVDDLAVQYLRSMQITVNKNETEKDENESSSSPKLSALMKETTITPLLSFEKSFLLSCKQNCKIIVGISVKPVLRSEINERIIQEFSTAIHILNLKYPGRLHFVFFPFAKTHSKIESDEHLTNMVCMQLSKENNNVTIFSHSDPLSWYSAIKDCVDIFIGMRFHSVIFATEASKPVLCIPYERKISEFIKGKRQAKDFNFYVMPPEDIQSFRIVNFVDEYIQRTTIGRLQTQYDV